MLFCFNKPFSICFFNHDSRYDSLLQIHADGHNIATRFCESRCAHKVFSKMLSMDSMALYTFSEVIISGVCRSVFFERMCACSEHTSGCIHILTVAIRQRWIHELELAPRPRHYQSENCPHRRHRANSTLAPVLHQPGQLHAKTSCRSWTGQVHGGSLCVVSQRRVVILDRFFLSSWTVCVD